MVQESDLHLVSGLAQMLIKSSRCVHRGNERL